MHPELAQEPESDDAWLRELARRARQAVSGEEPGELWGEVERRLRDELFERTNIF